jgi:hypothetical protein
MKNLNIHYYHISKNNILSRIILSSSIDSSRLDDEPIVDVADFKKYGPVPVGILRPCSSDFQCFSARYGDFSASFLPVPVVAAL